jgi:hypothetical protein
VGPLTGDLDQEWGFLTVKESLHHGVATGTWTGPDGTTTTVTFDRETRVHRLAGTEYARPHWAALASVLYQLEQDGHVPADDPDTREIRARLNLPFEQARPHAPERPCPDWCTVDHASQDPQERYVVPDLDLRTHSREIAAFDNPEGERVYVSVSITDNLTEGTRGAALVDVYGAECMPPEVAYEVASAIVKAAMMAGFEPAGIDPKTKAAADQIMAAVKRLALVDRPRRCPVCGTEAEVDDDGQLVCLGDSDQSWAAHGWTAPAGGDAEAREARDAAQQQLAEARARRPQVEAAAAAQRTGWRELTALRRLADDVWVLLSHAPPAARGELWDGLTAAYDAYTDYREGRDQGSTIYDRPADPEPGTGERTVRFGGVDETGIHYDTPGEKS